MPGWVIWTDRDYASFAVEYLVLQVTMPGNAGMIDWTGTRSLSF
jgi:hypothetical protein